MTTHEQPTFFIPENAVIPENGSMTMENIVELLRHHKENPDAVHFIADMLEK